MSDLRFEEEEEGREREDEGIDGRRRDEARDEWDRSRGEKV